MKKAAMKSAKRKKAFRPKFTLEEAITVVGFYSPGKRLVGIQYSGTTGLKFNVQYQGSKKWETFSI